MGERMLPVVDLTVFTKILHLQKSMKKSQEIPEIRYYSDCGREVYRVLIFLGRIFFCFR